MMAMWRRFYRLVLVVVWFIVMLPPSLIAQLGGWGGVRRVTWFTRLWARGLARIANLKLKVIGDPKRFRGGLILSNHLSYLDVLSHASVFRIRFAPKVEIRSWPVLGWYIAVSRPLWVDRKNQLKTRKIAEEYCETLRHQIGMLVYPEGTSTSGEEGLRPFKSTPFEAACQARAPIQPVITMYERTPDGRTPAWYGDQKLLPHIWWVLGQKEIRGTLLVLPLQEPCSGNEDRKEVANRMRKLMLAAYNELHGTHFQ